MVCEHSVSNSKEAERELMGSLETPFKPVALPAALSFQKEAEQKAFKYL